MRRCGLTWTSFEDIRYSLEDYLSAAFHGRGYSRARTEPSAILIEIIRHSSRELKGHRIAPPTKRRYPASLAPDWSLCDLLLHPRIDQRIDRKWRFKPHSCEYDSELGGVFSSVRASKPEFETFKIQVGISGRTSATMLCVPGFRRRYAIIDTLEDAMSPWGKQV